MLEQILIAKVFSFCGICSKDPAEQGAETETADQAGRCRHHGQSLKPQEPSRRRRHSRHGRLAAVPPALQSRSQSHRNGLLQTLGPSAKVSRPHHRRFLESHRQYLQPLYPRRMQQLLQSCRVWIQLTVRCSNAPCERGRAYVRVHDRACL